MIYFFKKNKKAFTLIELLVVLAIISLLSSVVFASVNDGRVRARDAKRKQDLRQLGTAVELYYDKNGSYPGTDGWIIKTEVGTGVQVLVPASIPAIPYDPNYVAGSYGYHYWLKNGAPSASALCNFTGYTYSNNKFALYAQLEKPSAADIATLTGGDAFDQCVRSVWNMNFKVGN